MIEWKNEWNSARPEEPLKSDEQVRRRFITLYKAGASLNHLSIHVKNRISASGIRAMLIRRKVKIRGRGGRHGR